MIDKVYKATCVVSRFENDVIITRNIKFKMTLTLLFA